MCKKITDEAYWNMTYDDHEQAAFTKAQETVAEYAKNTVDGLSWADPSSSSGNECQHMVQISSMTSGDEGLTLEEKRSLRLFNDNDVLKFCANHLCRFGSTRTRRRRYLKE
jgi:phosphoribosyl-dephospho-CoA transferase